MKYGYKDSGIEWLGKVPEHWQAVRLKTITSKVNSGVTPKGGATSYVPEGVPLIRSQNVMSGVLDFSDIVFISDETHHGMRNSWVQQGDVLLNITGASLGRTAQVNEPIEANVNQHVCIIRPIPWKVRTHFLAYLVQSELAQAQIFSSFTGSGREGLGYKAIKQINLPLPPPEEQAAIAAYLDGACAKLDRIIGLKGKAAEGSIVHQQTEILKAFRKSLIHECVTGKKQVFGVASKKKAAVA